MSWTSTPHYGLRAPVGTDSADVVRDLGFATSDVDTALWALFLAAPGHHHSGVDGDGPQLPTTALAAAAVTVAKMAASPSAASLLTSDASSVAWQSTVFTTFTPTVKQNASAVAATAINARYLALGKLAIVLITLAMTGTGTSGTDISIEGIPAAVAPKYTSTNVLALVGSGLYVRVGGAIYSCGVLATSASQLKLAAGGASLNVFLGSNPSFAIAANDAINLALCYEIA